MNFKISNIEPLILLTIVFAGLISMWFKASKWETRARVLAARENKNLNGMIEAVECGNGDPKIKTKTLKELRNRQKIVKGWLNE